MQVDIGKIQVTLRENKLFSRVLWNAMQPFSRKFAMRNTC